MNPGNLIPRCNLSIYCNISWCFDQFTICQKTDDQGLLFINCKTKHPKSGKNAMIQGLNTNIDGPEGCPNNLQSAWRLAELFFWSDLSWSRADLWTNSYVISTCFSLLSRFTLCTHYISYVGILDIIHIVLFRISIIFDNMDMDYL